MAQRLPLDMLARFFRSKFALAALALALACGTSRVAWSQDTETAPPPGEAAPSATLPAPGAEADRDATPSEHGAEAVAPHGEAKGHVAGGEESRPVFEAEHPSWFNILARNIFATPAEKAAMAAPSGSEPVHYVAKYDWLLYTPLLWLLVALFLVGAAKKARVRPEGKPTSAVNFAEWMVESFQDYLIGVMGEPLARKYTPLIASFFFTILFSNWVGLIPGMAAVTVQPAVPIAMAIVGFVAVHIIAIKEAGFKSWIMHFVGEPLWLAPLNFPLHIVGELVKPISLSLRLLCNVFGEEAVITVLTGLAVSLLPIWLPIPFQLPMLLLGTFFGFLQALVFSTLLSIYLSIFATHHDDGHGHPSTEHAVDNNGHHHIVGHPAEAIVG